MISRHPVVAIYDKFAKAFSKAVESMEVGNGFSEGVVQVMNVIISFPDCFHYDIAAISKTQCCCSQLTLLDEWGVIMK